MKDKVDAKVSEKEKVCEYTPVLAPMHDRLKVEEQMQRRYQVDLLWPISFDTCYFEMRRTQARVTATVRVAYIRVTMGISRYLKQCQISGAI